MQLSMRRPGRAAVAVLAAVGLAATAAGVVGVTGSGTAPATARPPPRDPRRATSADTAGS